MKAIQYLFNIQGSIEKYADFKTAEVWFSRAAAELPALDLAELIDLVSQWALVELKSEALVEDVFTFLADIDPAGDAARRANIQRIRSVQLEKRRAQQKRDEELEQSRRKRELKAAEVREARAREAQLKQEREQLEREQEELRRERERLQEEKARAQMLKAEAAKKILYKKIDVRLREDFLSAEDFFHTLPKDVVSIDEFNTRKVGFVRRWFAERAVQFKHTSTFTLDSEQLAAVAAVNGHVQVVARAGSGKTATLVSRVLFLMEHCKAPAEHILILAFNRKASVEIRRRLLGLCHPDAESLVESIVARKNRKGSEKQTVPDQIGHDEAAVENVAQKLNVALPHVMTFHALAYAFVHPEESILSNGAEGESQALSRTFQQVVDDHLLDRSSGRAIRKLMMAHFRADWDRITAGGYDQGKEGLLKFRRSMPRESMRGDYVKSYGEKLIADFLFEHDVAYKYERNHWWDQVNYRPDFTLFKTEKSGVIIEYFGLSGDVDYDEMSAKKREYWQSKKSWELLEFSPSDVAGDADRFRHHLKLCLEEQGVACKRLTEDEIWHRIRNRAIDRFSRAMVGFVGRCRKMSLSPAELQSRIHAHDPLSELESMFLGISTQLYAGYLDRLEATGEEDFDGLMQRAIAAVVAGATKFHRKSGVGDIAQLRYICIDEFQDFSDLFHRLLSAIRQANLGVEVFAVGDDWQAINGFAGSDLKFFQNFEEYVGKYRRLYISNNYRSTKSVVSVGNALMANLGKRAVAHKSKQGEVLVADATKFEPSLIEKQRHPGDVLTPMVTRIAREAIREKSHVVMLARRNSLPWFVNFSERQSKSGRGLTGYLESVRLLFPSEQRNRISISTAHRYKGLEKPTVIVMDAIAKSYPLIHPDWVFSRILGDSPESITEEERRLFYVALTRAIDRLVIITDSGSISPFLHECLGVQSVKPIDWPNYPPLPSLSARVIVRVGNRAGRGFNPTFEIKDQLKAAGYQWQAKGWSSWAKTFPAEEFKIETAQAEVWALSAHGIEVRVYAESEEWTHTYYVDSGQWSASKNQLVSSPLF